MTEPIKFFAAIYKTTVSKDGSAKVTLETSADELAPVMRLATMGEMLLRVTVEA